MGFTAAERETIIGFTDDNQTATVYTAQRRIMTRLTKIPDAKLIESGEHEGSPWAKYEIPARLISFRASRIIDDSTRQRLAERAGVARAARNR